MFIQDRYANNHVQNLLIFFLFLKNLIEEKWIHTDTHITQPAHLLKRIAWILYLFCFFIQIASLFVFWRVFCSHHSQKGSEKALTHLFTLMCNWLIALLCKYHESLFCSGLVTMSCLTLCDPMDCSHQAPLSMGFSKQEYWSRLPFFPPWYLPSPGIKPESPVLQANSLPK